QRLARHRPGHHVPADDDGIHACRLDGREDRLQRGEVAVDVVQRRESFHAVLVHLSAPRTAGVGRIYRSTTVTSQATAAPPIVTRTLSSIGRSRNSSTAAPTAPATAAIGGSPGLSAAIETATTRFTASPAANPSQLFPQAVRRRPHRLPTTAAAASP